jgi:glycosyltransferase involved in cell wall biosynthesis
MGTRPFSVQNAMPQLFKPKKLGQRDPLVFPAAKPAKMSGTPTISGPEKPLISVIIPAHNEEQYLPKTLQALHGQTFKPFEVVVIANGCTDHTAEVARGRCHQLIVLSQKSLGVARNLGARIAKGQLLVFLDADTLLDSTGLETIAAEFRAGNGAGTVRGVPDVRRLKYRLMYGIKNLVHRSSVHHGSSGVILCWKRHFMQTGGFDEGLEVRENSELIRRLMRFGKYKYLRKVAATTSMRRYTQRGFWRMIWLWLKLWFHSLFGDLHQRKYETVR